VVGHVRDGVDDLGTLNDDAVELAAVAEVRVERGTERLVA
jgi:hypothetical protein